MQGIPVVGAILVSPGLDRCLLVRGWGTQGSWGFPRGKINENEPDAACAVREVRGSVRVRLDPNPNPKATSMPRPRLAFKARLAKKRVLMPPTACGRCAHVHIIDLSNLQSRTASWGLCV